ncbi:putative YigZ family protein [Kineosphaera limosa]|uniref:Impact N-terminal domain-containing protein n=1 Tax=Kineosphaera limosa NBRC 100340 TaxID=1184609 RepID=K6WQH4_9MICO|nr:YigZ family protein [Kineosphaera limosa]NYE02906.1 putative YigZ family protein [Kineosphaera limosa]GAB94337.1 hypothetical protein KILIM_004_01290 [Kineosphaera limosa NBRC 100340]
MSRRPEGSSGDPAGPEFGPIDLPAVTSYRTLASPATAEIEAKRSRFLARLEPVADEEAAREVIDAARRAHHDARHHCSAFILGPDRRTERSNDDGEPAGTAGSPMLDVLRGSGYTDVVAVVTRWFGGTLLGTGGLIRAYSDAVSAALAQADPRVRRLRLPAYLDIGVADAGRIENELRAHGVSITGTDYGLGDGTTARVHLHIDPAEHEHVSALVAAATAGAGVLTLGDQPEWDDA